MYKKILSLNTTTSLSSGDVGSNKPENSGTITLKNLKAAAIIAASNSPSGSDVDVNDENTPSNFESANNSDKVIYETGTYERPLTASIHTSPTHTAAHIQHHHHHLSHVATPKIEGEMETDYGPQHTAGFVHKSIHHTTTSSSSSCDIMADENLENKQQNFVNEEEDVWRPW